MAREPADADEVIVVENDYTTRTLVVQYLEDTGYKVLPFTYPEEIGDQIRGCKVIVMDVDFGRERPPTAGVDYIIEQIQVGAIDPRETTIIFKSLWGSDHQDLPDRLRQIEKFAWWDCGEGLELTELREIIRKDR